MNSDQVVRHKPWSFRIPFGKAETVKHYLLAVIRIDANALLHFITYLTTVGNVYNYVLIG